MEPHQYKQLKVSVILPSYNERENIAEAIERITKTLNQQLLEIIVVDDNSPDETWKLVEEINHPQVVLIRRINEKGLASALATGVGKAQGNIIVWMDCDLGLPPEEIPRLLEKLDEYDIAVGSRFVGNGQDLRAKWIVMLSYLVNLFAWFVLGSHIKDYTSGFIALKKEVLESVKINPKGFGEYFIEFIYTCSRRNFKIVEVDYIYKDRAGGVSKSNDNLLTFLKLGWQYGMKILWLRLKWKK